MESATGGTQLTDAGSHTFPFTAVVGSEEVKLALLLCVIDPMIGGVLIRGERGAGKTTLVRGLASLLGATVPFVELPMGATEDRIKGSLDVARALKSGEIVVQSGLLGRANGGILYVDEINLLPDHLVDLILDASATGVNIVERDGISLRQPSRFVLVGTMNPEEGDLRPQLLDRFGLCIDGESVSAISDRTEAVRRRLYFEADPEEVVAGASEEELLLKNRLMRTRDRLVGLSVAATLTDDVLEVISARSQAEGVQGLRGDLTLARAARALALFEGRDLVDVYDVERVAPMVFAHRRRLNPLDQPGSPRSSSTTSRESMSQRSARDRASESTDRSAPTEGRGADPTSSVGRSALGATSAGGQGSDSEVVDHSSSPGDTVPSQTEMGFNEEAGSDGVGDGSVDSEATTEIEGQDGSRTPKDLPLQEGPERVHVGGSARSLFPAARHDLERGRPSFELPPKSAGEEGAPLHLVATVQAMVERHSGVRENDRINSMVPQTDDLRYRHRSYEGDQCVIFLVDTSGSMGAEERIRLARESAVTLLQQAYQRRLKVALVTFADGRASIRLRPTKSVEVAVARFDAVTYGGRTPLGDGLARGIEVVQEIRRSGMSELVVLLTDGRVNQGEGSGDPLADAMRQAERMSALAVRSVVCDFENSPVPLGLAQRFAAAMGATYVPYGGLSAVAQQ